MGIPYLIGEIKGLHEFALVVKARTDLFSIE
jgi:hypothetical protein